MAEIIWTEPALNELDASTDYIAVENPPAARATDYQPPPSYSTRQRPSSRVRYRRLPMSPLKLLER